MSIFGPFSSRTTSAVTRIFPSAVASVVTLSPSTRSSAGSSTVAPAPADRRSTTTTSPTATFSWRPPAFTIAYTTLLLISARLPLVCAVLDAAEPAENRARVADTQDQRALRRADVQAYGIGSAGSNEPPPRGDRPTTPPGRPCVSPERPRRPRA